MRLRGAWADAEVEARRASGELQGTIPSFAGEAYYEVGEIRLRMGDLAGARERQRMIAELKQLRSEMLLLAEAERQGSWTPSWQQLRSLPAAGA